MKTNLLIAMFGMWRVTAAMVDQSIFCIDRGALGTLHVTGMSTPAVFRPPN